MSANRAWWHDSVYQVCVRSFADGNGDGRGDLPDLRSKLDWNAPAYFLAGALR